MSSIQRHAATRSQETKRRSPFQRQEAAATLARQAALQQTIDLYRNPARPRTINRRWLLWKKDAATTMATENVLPATIDLFPTQQRPTKHRQLQRKMRHHLGQEATLRQNDWRLRGMRLRLWQGKRFDRFCSVFCRICVSLRGQRLRLRR